MPTVTRLTLPEVLLLEYPVNQDSRSIFHITFSKEHMLQAGIENEFVEEITYHPMKKILFMESTFKIIQRHKQNYFIVQKDAFLISQ